ncbi:hypothetical protein U1872_03735 [Sphingomonas sp. RB3P16]|uniref:hypothetical protein n=1 Tax=Parasphingomonas frigoris TaxID=3096163 RepID=UPI002FCA0CA3
MRQFLRLILLPVIAAAVPAGAQSAKRATTALTVVPLGSEQALQLGKAVIARPFGAQLVDRIEIVGSYAAGRTHYYLVRGDGGTECPARYLVVAAARGETPVTSSPFGTCSGGATGRLASGRLTVTLPSAPGARTLVRFGYMRGIMRPLDPILVGDRNEAGPVARCGVPAADAIDPVGDGLDRDFPDVFRRTGELRKVVITPLEMRDIVANLACLSALPGAEPRVPQAATALFASRTHGALAFTTLDTIARSAEADPGLRASVRSFGSQMRYFVGRREPL